MARTPSTQALRALEAFSRHGTVWAAADELHLTRSAVSHHLRLLERDLGFRLFNRVGTRIELTPRGRAYAGDVRQALAMIRGSAARNAGHDLSGNLTISCTPGFATTWLSPKIGRFRASFPDIALSVVTPRRLDEVSNPDVDLFVAFGTEAMSGVEIELLKEVEFTPLCSPALLNRLGAVEEPGDILRAGLLHLADTDDWLDWARLAGLPEDAAAQGIIFSDMNLVYAAALNGQGIAMGDSFVCHEAIVCGQLVRPFELAVRSPKSYYLAVPPEKADIPAVAAFRGWLLDEMPLAGA